MVTVFTLNFLPYKPTGPVSSNIYRPTINSTGTNLKTILMTINSIHQNSKHDHIPNILGTCQLCIRPKKNICVFTVTCQKNLGSVGRHYFFYFFFFFNIGKTGNSRARFRNPIPVFHFRNFR